MKTIGFLLCFCVAVPGQTSPTDAQILQTLLAEVHQLRLALEHSSKIVPLIQIAVERLKLQQDQVARAARQLEDIRRELDHFRSEQPKIQQRLQSLDNNPSQITDPRQRKELDEALKIFKLEAEQSEKSVQQLQARESELMSQFQAEQTKLTELNDRLDQMERALNRQ
jgi:predicted  nucleic acid-binding Zn-ribbon protein